MPGEGAAQIFAKIPGGGCRSRFSGPNFQGVFYFGFYCVFSFKFLENFPEGLLFHPITPVRIYDFTFSLSSKTW